MNNIKYRKLFPPSVEVEALKRAEETRKFEIQLYWKRLTYFWAFVGAAFAAYVHILKNEISYINILVCFIGLSFTYAWYAISKGSKYWQENWESHIDILENTISGPLYKVVKNPNTKKGLLRAKALSVSRINMMVSINIIFVWNILYILELKSINLFSVRTACNNLAITVIMLITNIFIYWEFFVLTKSMLNTHDIDNNMSVREQ